MDKAKKKRIQKYISWGCIALVILVLAVMPLLAGSRENAAGPQASILSGTVGSGSIGMALHGGGTLENGSTEDVVIPTGVRITEFLVDNGDLVTAGTPLATVDKVSVMNAITQVQETLEYLRGEMEGVQNETVSSSVCAKAGGRVKKLYAQAGDDVQTVMLENGALAVLSLDGLMAVKLENSGLSTGEAVLVTLSDGTEVSGRVESCLNGEAVITVADDGYAMGEPVTVTTGNGSQAGSGELYIHNAWNATAFTGTVNAVRVKEEASVSSGATLFTLTDTAYTGQLDSLASLHREYEEQLQDLFRMYQEGTISAPCDGKISGVEKDSVFLLSGEEVRWEAVPLVSSSAEAGWTLLLLSNVEETEPMDAAVPYTGYAGIVTGVGIDGLILSVNETPYAVSPAEEGLWDLTGVNLDPALMLTRDVPFATLETEGYAAGDIVVLIYDNTGSFLDIVTAQQAEQDPVPTEPAEPMEPSDPSAPSGEDPSEPSLPGGGMPGGDMSSNASGGAGGMSGMTGSLGGAAAQEPEFNLYDLEGGVLMTVTVQDTVTLTITVDEQDIAKVSTGQIAEVEVAALRGQTFEAEVTKIGTIGTNSGGSSKFTVELTMEKSEDMLAGMSVTASIPLYTKVDVLTIPVAALTEDGTATVVYTALDEETGAPTAPVAVTVGISDGETAELLSGLDSGDSFYYCYYDTLELSEKVESVSYSFGRK